MMYRKRNIDGTLGDWVLTPTGLADKEKEEAEKKELAALKRENTKLKKAQEESGK